MPRTRGVKENITYVFFGLIVVCFVWEVLMFATNQKATFSETLRRLNFATGGLVAWGLIALLLHATIPWPLTWHNREAYIAAWGSSPDLDVQ